MLSIRLLKLRALEPYESALVRLELEYRKRGAVRGLSREGYCRRRGGVFLNEKEEKETDEKMKGTVLPSEEIEVMLEKEIHNKLLKEVKAQV